MPNHPKYARMRVYNLKNTQPHMRNRLIWWPCPQLCLYSTRMNSSVLALLWFCSRQVFVCSHTALYITLSPSWYNSTILSLCVHNEFFAIPMKKQKNRSSEWIERSGKFNPVVLTFQECKQRKTNNFLLHKFLQTRNYFHNWSSSVRNQVNPNPRVFFCLPLQMSVILFPCIICMLQW